MPPSWPGCFRSWPTRTGAVDPDSPTDAAAARLRLFDAVARFLERLARRRPTLVVLDDLQWADESSLQLLEFITQPVRPVPLMIVGAYRHDELGTDAARVLARIAARGESLPLHGLSAGEVFDLVAAAVGGDAARGWAAEVHRRSGGHPFLARQLAELLADPAHPAGAVPVGVHDLVARRVERLSSGCRELVKTAAVAGDEVSPDVLAEVCALDAMTVTVLIAEAVHGGVLVTDLEGGRTRLAHDLFREVICLRLAVPQRMALHQRIADALEHRYARGGAVEPADLARHCAAAVTLDGPGRAITWARAAAEVERARLGFTEAAAHLARARRAIEASGDDQAGPPLVDLLVEEADARVRAGDPPGARGLLDDATRRAAALDDAERLGHIALGVQRLGARFAMPRDAVIDRLEIARRALDGSNTVLEAQLTASLARELTHSIPEHRARAGPLSERALVVARAHTDPATLAACLLARHDVLWTPGRAAQRVDLAREIAGLAGRTADPERLADGVLLTATALLEQGSAAFRASVAEYLYLSEGFGQPRHAYLALTRRTALALIDGRLDEAEQLIENTAGLGERIGEPDTENVRTGQMLELARARGEPDLLRVVAAAAIRCWVGVPLHAYAVAAGLLARAGEPDDLDAARRALDTATATEAWRDDRSYLWSLFIGGLATAAVRLGDRELCTQLHTELQPLTSTCGVGGSLVCFVGSNAHWAGIVAAALGRVEQAHHWLNEALTVHRRLGARTWEAETHLELAALGADDLHAQRAAQLATELGLTGVLARLPTIHANPPPASPNQPTAELCRDGELWRIRYRNTAVHLRDAKGLTDLHILLARPGTDVHVLELAGATHAEPASGTPLDATARLAYRRRLAELDHDLAAARADHDIGRAQHLDTQRTALVAELRRATGLTGRSRSLGASTTERARKTVTSRLREAVRRIHAVLPELGEHLDRSILTGTTCRYQPTTPMTWKLKAGDK